jgi:hypothetical protein
MRLSLYRLKPLGARLVTETGEDFDEARYSRFKHGDGVLAQRYGRELAGRLLSAAPWLTTCAEPMVIASAPYKYLPTASQGLALHVRRVVNVAFADSGRPPAEIGALRMSSVDAANYATLDTALRKDLLRQANLYVDTADFAGRHVILVDDARITGLAEAAATALVTAAGARTVTALYVVQIAEERGPLRPDVEHRINHAFVRDLTCLLQVYRSDRFVLNIRTVKYILGYADCDALDRFFARLSRAELQALDDAARNTGPEFSRCYRESLRRLRAALGRFPTAASTRPVGTARPGRHGRGHP